MLSLLKNKHVVVAMIVAPILAVIAYLAVDHYVAETPRQAQQGNSYRLLAMSNCRYQSGRCTLKNGDVEALLTAERVGEEITFTLSSELSLSAVMIATAEHALPMPMQPSADETGWRASLRFDDPATTVLRVAMNIDDALYYAETTAVFIDYDTGFSRENFER